MWEHIREIPGNGEIKKNTEMEKLKKTLRGMPGYEKKNDNTALWGSRKPGKGLSTKTVRNVART